MARYDVPDMIRLTEKLHTMRVVTSCMTCEHFEESSEFCSKYFTAPPARVVAKGCIGWEDNVLLRYTADES